MLIKSIARITFVRDLTGWILMISLLGSCLSNKINPVTKIAYLGPPASFTHLAAGKKFPSQTLIFQNSIEDCFRSVRSGSVEKAVVPLKNSIGGIVLPTEKALKEFPDIQVEDSLELPISQNLMIVPGTITVKKIYSHPQALRQSRHFIDSLYPAVPRIEYSSTSAAAQWVSDHPAENGAAIANTEAARLYKLKIINSDIQDDKNNRTKFIIISKKNKELP
ncbi:prephenate dehydratase [Chryseobacterium phosphatilyticum]|uniref:Bifunctional chorismate mutase/prephenate dehydratase n=1 Tax=Chryseobacterium phosphatilyticum TaxID=475075 RepID=A0A316XCS3_9FLAO|nr:prephenate dehydratase domain-containing protein [Chryseobacterium phosphatilyticum]PWN71497.1 prephenate dehydratase [Chryseobacterium phosphatilyticum]